MSGLTDTREALQMAKKILESRRRGAPTYVFVITDSYNRNDPTQVATEIRALPGVTLLGIGISTDTNM